MTRPSCARWTYPLIAHAPKQGRIGDLVTVEMEDRQDRAIMHRIEKLVRMPRGGERSCLGLAVADDAGHDQVGIIKGRAIGVHQRLTEFAALMYRSRRFRRGMARDAARE